MKVIFLSVISVIMASTPLMVAGECTEPDQVNHCLYITFDAHAEEVSTSLKCNNEIVAQFENPVFSFAGLPAGSVYQGCECIPKDQTCEVTVGDDIVYADGLRDGELKGNIVYEVDEKVICEYQGTQGPSADYHTWECCSGPACVAGRNAGQPGSTECSKLVRLEMKFDDFAEETGFGLVCGDETLWDYKLGHFHPSQAHTTINEQACLHVPSGTSVSCRFIVTDGMFEDGMTAGDEGPSKGHYSLMAGSTLLAEYDGTAFSMVEHIFELS